MPARTPAISHDPGLMSASELKAKALKDKLARRRYLMTAPIPEKLRILEEMRDLTRATRGVREANKTRMKAFRLRTEKA